MDVYISVMSNNFTGQHGPKPPLPGEVARRSRDGEVAASLIQPLSQPPADSSPARGAFGVRSVGAGLCSAPTTRDTTPPRKKVQTGKSGLHLLLMADILRQLAANPIPPYQAARSMMPVM